jgi:hypothetical protein
MSFLRHQLVRLAAVVIAVTVMASCSDCAWSSRIPPTQGLGGVLANLVGAGEPAKIARAPGIVGNKEAHPARLARGQGWPPLLGFHQVRT